MSADRPGPVSPEASEWWELACEAHAEETMAAWERQREREAEDGPSDDDEARFDAMLRTAPRQR